jgi:glutamyl-tRNA reductase
MYLSKAIKKLKPNSEYSFTEEDYSTIQWYKLEGKAPTQAEIDDAIEEVKANELTEAQAKADAKAAAQAKLAALGLTVEDLQALGL